METVNLSNKLAVSEDGDLLANGDLLIYQYPAGDYDVMHWPCKEEDMRKLASCCFDAREMGQLRGDTSMVELPNGQFFNYDLALVELPQYEWETNRAERY